MHISLYSLHMNVIVFLQKSLQDIIGLLNIINIQQFNNIYRMLNIINIQQFFA